MKKNKAVFWDRDGIINKIKVKNGKSLSPRIFSDFKVFPFIKNILIETQSLGYLNIIFTNQPDISRLLMDPSELKLMHEFLERNFAISKIYTCPHSDEDNCDCRKPLPGMLISALKEFSLNSEECYVVGDRITDIIAGDLACVKHLYLLEKNYSYNCYSKNQMPTFKTISSVKDIPNIIKANHDKNFC